MLRIPFCQREGTLRGERIDAGAVDFTNVLRLTPCCCFSPGITHSIILSLYIFIYIEIINMLMMR